MTQNTSASIFRQTFTAVANIAVLALIGFLVYGCFGVITQVNDRHADCLAAQGELYTFQGGSLCVKDGLILDRKDWRRK